MPANLTVNLSDDPSLNRHLDAAVRLTVKESTKFFSAGPPVGALPIKVFLQPEGSHPITRITTDPNVYQIGLNLEVYKRPYAQLIFQLGHELCHVFADPRSTNWFVESCCEMMSQVILRRMSEAWKKVRIQGPYVEKRLDEIKIKKYAENRIREASMKTFQIESLPDLVRLREWFISIKGSLQQNPCDRQRNVIIAEMLRPLFEESRDNWDALCFLGKASASPPVNLTDLDTNSNFEFNKWMDAAPDQLKDLIRRIRNMFQNEAHTNSR
ncbi:hypothetical protein ES707_09560 [subsurface metagenome]